MKNCKTCKFWRERKYRISLSLFDTGVCDAVDTDQAAAQPTKESPAVIEVDPLLYSALITHASFGCTMHEPRGAE